MLTQTYTTGRWQHYSREDQEGGVTNKFIIKQRNKNSTHSTQNIRHNVARNVQKGRIWIIQMLKPTTYASSFNTMLYKGRDSASGMGRKMSIIRPGATTVVPP
jgi:hypothetical protein